MVMVMIKVKVKVQVQVMVFFVRKVLQMYGNIIVSLMYLDYLGFELLDYFIF